MRIAAKTLLPLRPDCWPRKPEFGGAGASVHRAGRG